MKTMNQLDREMRNRIGASAQAIAKEIWGLEKDTGLIVTGVSLVKYVAGELSRVVISYKGVTGYDPKEHQDGG